MTVPFLVLFHNRAPPNALDDELEEDINIAEMSATGATIDFERCTMDNRTVKGAAADSLCTSCC